MTGIVMVTKGGGCGGGGDCGKGTKGNKGSLEEENQLSMVAMLLESLRKSLVSCRIEDGEDMISTVHHMEIGCPTNVQHITHVTFDRFNGFLGLPVEFQVEIPGRVPSASASVFGVSAESMQCTYDAKGNSVPTILLLLQGRLYSQGGLKAEGIFRINPENSEEEQVREQLNSGIVPGNMDVHCLAALIKAWFRELPSGVLDGLSPEQVMQCNTEEEAVELVDQLNPTQTALLNWAVDLMADVVQLEHYNKMNARNIAMVFAPNMTQMSDPLTALMHAVQVMNLLKTLITRTLREREEAAATGGYSPMSSRSSGQQSDEDFDCQQEMDDICELRQSPSDYVFHDAHYTPDSEDDGGDEVESRSETEESPRQSGYNRHDTCAFSEHQVEDLPREDVSSRNSSDHKMESDVSFTDSKNENSSSVTTDEEEDSSVIALEQKIERSPAQDCENKLNNTLAKSILPMQVNLFH